MPSQFTVYSPSCDCLSNYPGKTTGVFMFICSKWHNCNMDKRYCKNWTTKNRTLYLMLLVGEIKKMQKLKHDIKTKLLADKT